MASSAAPAHVGHYFAHVACRVVCVGVVVEVSHRYRYMHKYTLHWRMRHLGTYVDRRADEVKCNAHWLNLAHFHVRITLL